MADWTTRPAVATDVEAVAALRAVVLRADLERLGRYDEQRVRQRLRDAFKPAYASVIEVRDTFAGFTSGTGSRSTGRTRWTCSWCGSRPPGEASHTGV